MSLPRLPFRHARRSALRIYPRPVPGQSTDYRARRGPSPRRGALAGSGYPQKRQREPATEQRQGALPFTRRHPNIIQAFGEPCGAEMVRRLVSCCAAAWVLAAIPVSAAHQYAQYYPPPPGYGPPPCQAVTPGPLRGAARGAAGGAIFGAIGGNAGRGAAIGAGVGAIGGAIRRGTARSSGYCY